MIYFDNSATTLIKPPQVAQAVYDAINTMGNSGRGAYNSSISSSMVLYETRELIAKMFNLHYPEQVAFTLNATEALNTAINYFHSNTQIITLEYYDECYSVFTSDIVYITIEERKAAIITRQKKFYTNKKLSYWKEKLKDYDYFAQPHYSYLVNLRYVSDFNKTELNINVDLKSETLPISQRNYSNFKKAYFAYIGV